MSMQHAMIIATKAIHCRYIRTWTTCLGISSFRCLAVGLHKSLQTWKPKPQGPRGIPARPPKYGSLSLAFSRVAPLNPQTLTPMKGLTPEAPKAKQNPKPTHHFRSCTGSECSLSCFLLRMPVIVRVLGSGFRCRCELCVLVCLYVPDDVVICRVVPRTATRHRLRSQQQEGA